jgi:uncharacterized membrane protein YfcA
MEKSKGKNLLRLLLGCCVGAANSFFGGGGGMIAVPLLQKTGMREKEAHATAILLIFPISLLSFLLYFAKGAYDFSVLIPTSLGVSLGGFLGAKLLGKMSIRAVRLCFALLQLAAGVWLLWFL